MDRFVSGGNKIIPHSTITCLSDVGIGAFENIVVIEENVGNLYYFQFLWFSTNEETRTISFAMYGIGRLHILSIEIIRKSCLVRIQFIRMKDDTI